MRPAQRVKRAEDAASKLSRLVRSPQVVQLLQRPPPAQPTAAQQSVLVSYSKSLATLYTALPADGPNNDAGRAVVAQLLRAVLRHQPAQSAGLLMVWTQQQPQQLAAMLQSHGLKPQHGTIHGVWVIGTSLVFRLATLLASCMELSSCRVTTAELSVNLTQQLLQSGGCCWGLWFNNSSCAYLALG